MVLTLLALCGALTGPAPARRCRCVPPAPVTTPRLAAEFLAETHAAFRGRVISSRPITDTIARDALTGRPSVIPATDFKVVVVKWWGETGFDTVHVQTATDPAACGAEIELGVEYLFLSYKHVANRVGVSACLPPQRPESAATLMQLLDSAAVLRKGRRQ